MKKPILYIDPDGTLLLEGDKPDLFLHSEINPYAAPFMKWATEHFEVRWLTERPPAHVFHLAERLGIPGHKVPYTGFAESKSSAVGAFDNFYWLDSNLTPMDVDWLTRHSKTDRVIAIHSPDGVSPAHKEWLSAKVTGKKETK